jgi:predicted RNA polymerase sigma factor
LVELDALEPSGHYRADVVRAHLLERSGDLAGAGEYYAKAAQRTLSAPEQRYLESRALRCLSGKP